MYVKKLIAIVTILVTSLACNLVQSAVQDEVMQSEQIETMESEAASVPTNESTSESETISTKSTDLEFVEVPTDGTVVTFKMATTEVSNEQYVQFLNEAIVAGFITYNSVDHKVYDQDGNEMIWLAGSRVVKDHDKDGVYVVEEMENPLNRCYIDFNTPTQQFEVVDPATVDWSVYFDPALYPNVVDSIDDWYELSGNSNGFVGEGDLDGLMPTLEEVRSWPVNFIRYYGAAAFAEFYGYDLPTVAQWKLAARGGEDFEYATSDGTANAGIAWINIDGPGGPPHKGHVQPIDSNSPNPLGIYHLGGNVWEWVKDWYRGTEVFSRDKQESDFYLADNPEDAAHLKGLFGGSFNYFPATMKVSWNHAAKPNTGNDHFGFRVVINEDDEYVENISESQSPPKTISDEVLDLTELWSYGLTSIRTGEPLIEEGGEHQLDESIISYGYNLAVDKNGNVLSPRAAPLHGGEQLIHTEEYQNDHNMREYAQIFTIMATIRDTILYHFEETTREEWLSITEVLTLNGIKTEGAPEINGRSVLSTEQVYDYIESGNAEGSPVMRYLEEAGLELKCLAFKDFDFTNPKGNNHCTEHNIDVGSGIKFP